MANAQQEAFQMAARFADMPDAELPQYTKDLRFGALALAEISRRNRVRMVNEAAQAQGVDGSTIADQQIAEMMQAKLRERMMNDDRLGLNNVVASAEQGAIDFGGEPQGMAGGGMVSFEDGGEVPGYALGGLLRAGKAGIDALRGMTAYDIGRFGGRGVAALKNNPEKAAIGTASTIPFFSFLGGGDDGGSRTGLGTNFFNINNEPTGSAGPARPEGTGDVEEQKGGFYGDEGKKAAAPTKAEKKEAAGIAKQLGTDAKSILEERRRLEKEMGLGEYGAEAKKILEKRKERAAKAGEAEYIEKLQEGIRALGGKRRTDTIGMLGEGLGAIAGATGAEKKARISAEDAADEVAQKIALAEDLYKRGDIAAAQKMAAEARKDQADLAYKTGYLDYLKKASTAKGAGTFRGADIAKISTEIQNILGALRATKDPTELQYLQNQLKILRAAQARAMLSGASITNEPDAAE